MREVGGPACTERVMPAFAAWAGTRRTLSRPTLRTLVSRREKTIMTLKRVEKDIEKTSLSKMHRKRKPTTVLATEDQALLRSLLSKRCKSSEIHYLRSAENKREDER
jgi:hypothetical protein